MLEKPYSWGGHNVVGNGKRDGLKTSQIGQSAAERDMRKCKVCLKVLPLEDFPLYTGGRHRHRCHVCHKQIVRNISAGKYITYHEQALLRTKNRYIRHRSEVLAHYGNECACCGESEPLFLAVDHINNDGSEHRRSKDRSSHNNMYGWLVRNGFPDGFQILCSNCNHGKHRNGGTCPHVTKVQRLGREPVGPSGPKHLALFCEEVKI